MKSNIIFWFIVIVTIVFVFIYLRSKNKDKSIAKAPEKNGDYYVCPNCSSALENVGDKVGKTNTRIYVISECECCHQMIDWGGCIVHEEENE